LRDCVLSGATLEKAMLDGVDLRGADIDGIPLHELDLHGVMIDAAQALALAQCHGAIVD
jgi:fluoroquinolone resistance protein